MMLYPTIETLLSKVDNRYTLVVMAAKRARQLNDELRNEDYTPEDKKTVTMAINEIAEGKITYESEE